MPSPSISRRLNEKLRDTEDKYYRHIREGDCIASLGEICPSCQEATVAGVMPEDEESSVLEEDDY